mmetsp:Transcript_18511/g.43165  ORF Transcript_18511/g.43165 Transcript_18511/m.43165 type:complete len:241 (+) Transcript_18511:279-1001(+)
MPVRARQAAGDGEQRVVGRGAARVDPDAHLSARHDDRGVPALRDGGRGPTLAQVRGGLLHGNSQVLRSLLHRHLQLAHDARAHELAGEPLTCPRGGRPRPLLCHGALVQRDRLLRGRLQQLHRLRAERLLQKAAHHAVLVRAAAVLHLSGGPAGAAPLSAPLLLHRPHAQPLPRRGKPRGRAARRMELGAAAALAAQRRLLPPAERGGLCGDERGLARHAVGAQHAQARAAHLAERAVVR